MPVSAAVKRAVAIAIFAASGAVAFATIAPRKEMASAPPSTPLVESLSLRVSEVAAPAQFIREDQFQRGDTLAGFLQRLGIDDDELKPIVRMPALRTLRVGTTVRAEISAAVDFALRSAEPAADAVSEFILAPALS